MSSIQKHEVITFGSFEVDLHSGEIRKYGVRVRLQSQPFRVLATLLSRPGEVVSREDLQFQIWGEHTTVDFERGIATAMSKLRDALGDSAEHPVYIETLAKRGFRFIAPVVIERPPEDLSPVLSREHQPLIATLPEAPPSAVVPAQAPILEGDVFPAPAAVGYLVSKGRTFAQQKVLAFATGILIAIIGLSAFLAFRGTRPSPALETFRISQLTQGSAIYYGPPNPENLLTLVSDGPRIYTSFLANGGPQIGSLDTSGSALEPISLPDELSSVSIADISRNGAKLIVRGRQSRDSEQPLWIVPRSGSSALRVGDVLAHDATFMPDGEHLLYAAGNGLYTVELNTGISTPYASLPGRAFWLRWSPSNDLLRFTLIDPVTHSSSLWELVPSTRKVHPFNLPELGGKSICCGSWSATGRAYVFQVTDAVGSDIWAMQTGPHGQATRLTNGPLSYVSPLPSRTESQVFFVGLEPPASTRFFDPAQHQFVPAPSFLERARRVTYSRDGKWVAWVDVDGRLWRARGENGSERLQLTPDNLDVFLAQWSPDHSQLVVMARDPGRTWQLYLVNTAGGQVRKILEDPRNLADPDWSPDGTKVVFGREPDLMGKESGPHDIKLLDLRSLQQETLAGSENLFSPRWSPDGRWIAALSLDQTRLLVYDVSTRKWRTLVTGSAADPVWGLDSKTIFFHAFADPKSAVLRVPVEGGRTEPVADMTNLGLPKVDSYFFGGITPKGAPIVQPRIGTGNLYSIHLTE